MAESRALSALAEVVRGLAPEISAVLERGRTGYSIAQTEALPGELIHERPGRSPEVCFAEAVFRADFPRAVATFRHEHAHIFGYDGSRGPRVH